MKKIISLLLTMLLVLVPAAIVGAEAEVDVTVDITVYTLDVTVKTDIANGLTLKLYPVEDGAVAAGTMPIYLGECTAPTVDGSYYVYNFDSFNVLKSTKTGTYRAVINGTYHYDFEFVNKTDKIEFYNAIAVASAAAVEGVLEDGLETGVIDFDLGNYFDLPKDVKDEVNECLADLELPALGSDPSDELVQSFEEIFKPEVARLLAVAEFVMADAEHFDAAVAENEKILGLDLKFYADEKLDMDPADVYARFSSLAGFGYDEEEVQDAFDLAVLLSMLDKSDYGSVTEALIYYNGGVIDLDTALTDDFTEAQLNKVSQEMKKEASAYSSASNVEAGYKKAANAIIGDDDEEEEVVRPSGGGGGGGGGSASNRRPGVTSGSTNVTLPETSTTVPVVNFSDLDQAAWASDAIKYLAGKGILSGKGDGKFYPNDIVTREEFVKIIVEAFKIYDENATADFDDVDESRWSYGYIASGVRAGIIKGISDTEFNPAGTITRQDMAVIINRTAKLLGLDLAGDSSVFTDDAQIAPYAKDAVGALADAGIIKGMGDGSFAPLGTVTRAQAAMVAYELMNAVGGAN